MEFTFYGWPLCHRSLGPSMTNGARSGSVNNNSGDNDNDSDK